MTKQSIKEFFAKVAEEADEIEDEVEAAAKKALALAGQFVRSTLSALAHDPIMTAAIQEGIGAKILSVTAAVETGGASLLPGLAAGAALELLRAVGHTAEHELLPIIQGEIHAAVKANTAAIPEHVNR